MTAPVAVIEAPAGPSLPEDPAVFLDGLAGPTIFWRAGRRRDVTRVVAGLLHGNEPSGLRAIHAYLRSGEQPAVDSYLFVGAVAAARAAPRHSCRRLPGGADLNRCFAPPHSGAEGAVAQAVLQVLTATRPEAVIDLHNNTGHNPAYGVVTALDGPRLELTALFAPRVVCSPLRLGTFTEAWEGMAPAVTIECGQAGTAIADETATAGLRRFLSAPELPATPPAGSPAIEVFGSPVQVKLRPGLGLAFAPTPSPDVAVTLDPQLDRHNFRTLPAGTPLGWVASEVWPLEARDERGRECSAEYFAVDRGQLWAVRPFVPIMMTTNAQVAVDDCLFYATLRQV